MSDQYSSKLCLAWAVRINALAGFSDVQLWWLCLLLNHPTLYPPHDQVLFVNVSITTMDGLP